MLETELINDGRKIKEWWKHLKTAGYIVPINQHMFRFVPDKMAAKLNIKITADGGSE